MTEESTMRWKNRLRAALAMGGCVSLFVPFYTVFAVETLWNWFLADAIHSQISYWQSLGILLLVSIFKHRDTVDIRGEIRWRRVIALMEASVPAERLESITESFKKEEDSWVVIVAEMKPSIAEFFRNTIFLVVGWAVHTFLVM